jgi:hypothetical protein
MWKTWKRNIFLIVYFWQQLSWCYQFIFVCMCLKTFLHLELLLEHLARYQKIDIGNLNQLSFDSIFYWSLLKLQNTISIVEGETFVEGCSIEFAINM